MTAKRLASLEAANAAVQRAEKQRAEVLRRLWPVGAEAAWERGGSCRGTVLDHGYGGDRLKVRNEITGAEYWLSTYFLRG